MGKLYERVNWEDKPSTKTPISAENLNKMDKGIGDLDDKLVEQETKTESLASQVEQIASNQIPEEYLKASVDAYIDEKGAGLVTDEELEAVNSQLSSEIVEVPNHVIKELNGSVTYDTSIKRIEFEANSFNIEKGEFVSATHARSAEKAFFVKKGDVLKCDFEWHAKVFEVDSLGNGIKALTSEYVAEYVFEKDCYIRVVVIRATNPNVLGHIPYITNFCYIVEKTMVNGNELVKAVGTFGKEMDLSKRYYVDSDIIVSKVAVNALDSKINIIRDGKSAVKKSRVDFVDFANNKIGFYLPMGDVSSSTFNLFREKTVSFDFVAGHEYVIESIKKANSVTIRVTDSYTMDSDEFTVIPTTADLIGEGWGYRYYTTVGTIEVKSFKNYSLEPSECRCLIVGDSFVEGSSIYNDKQKRYAYLIKKELGGSCFIDGMGGATVSECFYHYTSYLNELCTPKYVLIACGTNDTDYDTWLRQIGLWIENIKLHNSIPILVTITRRLDYDNSAFITQANEWIRNSGELYIDINRITTMNFDGVTQNEEMFLDDDVHPTVSTHELIFKKAKIDVPVLFN